jgi:hypothetical protein
VLLLSGRCWRIFGYGRGPASPGDDRAKNPPGRPVRLDLPAAIDSNMQRTAGITLVDYAVLFPCHRSPMTGQLEEFDIPLPLSAASVTTSPAVVVSGAVLIVLKLPDVELT